MRSWPCQFLICTILCCESFRLCVRVLLWIPRGTSRGQDNVICLYTNAIDFPCMPLCIVSVLSASLLRPTHTTFFCFTFLYELRLKPNMSSGCCDVNERKNGVFTEFFTIAEFFPSHLFLLILYHEVNMA